MTTEKNLTPMMEQYYKAKSESVGCVLFFRMGDFYEMFEEDAELCAKVLGLALTSRSKGANAIPMAGIPVKSLEAYLHKMLQAGYKVAICEQLQDASEAVQIVERGITRIVTPGTILEETILSKKDHNFLLALQPGKQKTGFAWVDLSTSLFLCHEVKNDRVVDEIYQIQPAEILIDEGLQIPPSSFLNTCTQTLRASVSKLPSKHFLLKNARQRLLNHFQTASLEGFGLEGMAQGISAAGAILAYLEETHHHSLPHLLNIRPFQEEYSLKLDRATIHCLELMETIRGGNREGTLIQILDQTQTAMGARLLKSWILAPLTHYEKILERQQSLTELTQEHSLREEMRQFLDKIYDLERISSRICCEQATPKDLIALGRSLQFTPPIQERLQQLQTPFLQKLYQTFDPLADLRDLIERAIREDAPQTFKDGDLIKDGYHPELDKLIQLCSEGKEWIAQFQAREIARTNIPLKIGYNRVFGYYIEITNSHKHKVPEDYHIKQTLKNGQRYFTTELKEYESNVLGAEEKRKELEHQLFLEVRKQIAGETKRIQKLAEICAILDVLTALAFVSAENGYQMPTIAQEERIVRIEEGKHPVLAHLLKGNECVPNSTLLESENQSIIILTGPNMSGKSTYIRQVALITLMAQMGMAIPAKSATIGIVDRIFTRIGAADELIKGNSTFMVEMTETANILNNATPRSLIILDEVGRGTSTFDGLAIAWAITEYIHKHLKSLTLFATHYHELTELADLFPGIRNCSVDVRECGDEILFLHRIMEGSTDKSYGIHVARLAGIPKKVIERAKKILEDLEFNDGLRHSTESVQSGPQQLVLFEPSSNRIVDTLKKYNLDMMSPMEAWMKLKELQELAKKDD